ncbi:MAG: hypothetical protein JO273_11790 [Methylobacteriaceae bacterium]|nr:hypothetical protein [Methylobacteriaceae bacterium]
MKNDTESIRTKNEALGRLGDARLTSVQFVMNYLVLGFDEKGALTTFVWPEIHCNGNNIVFNTPGYRDELCSLIEKVAKTFTIDINETIRIDFENGTELWIPLQSYKASGERAILTGPQHYLFVF